MFAVLAGGAIMIGQPFLSDLCIPLSATRSGADVKFKNVSIDTRTINKGALFVAISGPNFDGHDYLDVALKAGAVATLVSKPCDSELPQLQVTDTRVALGKLGGWVRDQFSGPVVAVTGSSGKTTVKSLLTSIFEQQGPVHATRGNLNNDFGVPLTLCELSDSHQSAVIELGASALGEIAYTAALVKAQCSIITNASVAHLEGFGSLQGIAKAKGEIVSALPANGTAVLNSDDGFFDYWCGLAGNRNIVSFSLADEQADFFASNIQAFDSGCEFELCTGNARHKVKLELSGQHNVINAVAAAAAASVSGVEIQKIIKGIAAAKPLPGRGASCLGVNGARIIDDSYNANPASFRAAIDMLSECQGKTVLVVGEMAELGSEAIEAHQQLGEYARLRGVGALLAVGPLSAGAAQAYGAGAFSTLNKQELIDTLKTYLDSGVTVLVKGSRSAGMDDVVKAVSGFADQGGQA